MVQQISIHPVVEEIPSSNPNGATSICPGESNCPCSLGGTDGVGLEHVSQSDTRHCVMGICDLMYAEEGR